MRRSATPLVSRCVYSMSVASAGARGTISPLQSGQCAPHPAPEPDARTYAPHRMTATFQPSVSHARRARRMPDQPSGGTEVVNPRESRNMGGPMRSRRLLPLLLALLLGGRMEARAD